MQVTAQTHAAGLGGSGETGAVPGMVVAKVGRHQNIDGLPDQLAASVTKHPLGLRVDEHDGARGVNHHHPARQCLDRQPEFLLRQLLLGHFAADEGVLLSTFRPCARPSEGYHMALLVDVARLEVARMPASARQAHLIARGIEILGIDEVRTAAPDHLVGSIAQDTFATRADMRERAATVRNENKIG